MRRILILSLLLASATDAAPARAQQWLPVGPPGGSVRSLATDPSHPQRLYLGTGDGDLYRSDDGGGRWQRLAPGFPLRRQSLDQISVDAHGEVYVGYWDVEGSGGGVARSADGGRTFEVMKGIHGESVRALALSPWDPQVIAAGSRTGVFLSRDGGHGWTPMTPPGSADLRNVESLCFDPTNPEALYVGTWHLAWKTTDEGATWAPIHAGMIDDSDVMTLTLDRRNPQTVYATACTGIYRSTDGALGWSKLPGIRYASRRTRAFCQSHIDANVLLAGTTAGLWISDNGGGTWRLSTPGNLVVNAVVMEQDGTIVLGTEGAGVLRSSDLGRTWVDSNNGFSEWFVSRLLFDPEGRGLVAAVQGEGGVFVTPGAGGPWTRFGEGLEGRQVLSLALQGETVLAGTDDGIFARAPEATHWARLPTRLDAREAHPRVTEILSLPHGRLLAATVNGVLASPDEGRSWEQASLGTDDEVLALAGFTDDRDMVIAATRSGFFRSADGGGTWRLVSPALPGATPHALTGMPTDDRVLFATTTMGLFRSNDRGTTWRQVTGGLPSSNLSGLVLDPDGRTIYASEFDRGGLFRSVNGGSTWTRLPAADLPSDHVWWLGLNPEAPGQVMASCTAGLYLRASTPGAGAAGVAATGAAGVGVASDASAAAEP